MRCEIYDFGTLGGYKFVVVFSLVNGKLLLSRHEKRSTWETQGGHIEKGETPLDAARRELYEESGARAAELTPLCDYTAADCQGQANGAVFIARIEVLEQLPHFEMAQTRLFDTLPPESELTYGGITPVLYSRAKRAGLL